MARWLPSRLHVCGIGAAVLLSGFLLAVPGVSQAGEEPTGARRATAAGPAVPAADRVALVPGEKGRSGIAFHAGSGDRQVPFAFDSTGGTVRAQQLGASAHHPVVQAATGAPERRARAAADDVTYKTTLTVDVPLWTAYNKFVSLWNRDTWTWVSVKNPLNSPSATATLPPGNYFVAVMYGHHRVDNYVLTKAFTVKDKAQTVRLDQKAARRTAIRVDDATARSESTTVCILLPKGASFGFAGGQQTPTYVTPTSLPGTTLQVQEVLVKSGSTAVKPSPYRYDLVKSWSHPVPPAPIATVQTASLAKTTLTVRAQGITTDAWYSTAPTTGHFAYQTTAMRLPATLTEYVTPGVTMGRLVSFGASQELKLKDRRLPAGTSPGETVGAGPLASTGAGDGDSLRSGSRMQVGELMSLGDAAGNRGSGVWRTTSVTLSSGGQVLRTSNTAHLSVAVPDQEQTYRLEQTTTRPAGWSLLSTKISSEWTFTSGWSPFTTTLPLMDLAIAATGLDQRNRASTAPVRLTVKPSTRQSTAVGTVDKVEWSVDDGATWAELPLTASGDGFEAMLGLPATATYASLRVTASNDQGGTLRRTVLRALAGPAAPGDESVGATTIANVKVNGGKALVPGPTGEIEVVSTFTASDPSGIAMAGLRLWHGGYLTPDGVQLASTRCTPADATTSTCTATLYITEPRYLLGSAALAGVWRAEVWALANDGTGFVSRRNAGSLTIKRTTSLTVNAAPEPVKKGKTITVTGALNRVDWPSWSLQAYPGQSVTLQWKKAKATTWTAVKIVKTDAGGELKTTVKAGSDGSYRFAFAGDTASHSSASGADYIDVQ